MGAPQYEQAGADIGGTGTTNTIPRWTGPSTLGDSVITQSGSNIGIGTASPSTRLHVSDNSSIPVIVQSSGSTDSYLRFINTSNNLGYIGYVGTNLYLAPNNGAGNVGIATPSPNARLEIASTTAGTAQFRLSNASGLTNWWEIGRDNATTGALIFTSNIGERMRIAAATSQVAIGTGSFTTGRAITTVADLDVFGVRVGRGAGDQATNTAVGATALNANTSGSANTAVGASALAASTTANANTAVGSEAGNALTSNGENTFIGQQAGYFPTNGENTGIGRVAMRGIAGSSTGSANTALGRAAMYSFTTGIQNTALGRNAGFALSSGNNNVLVGERAAETLTTGSANIVIGRLATTAAATDSNQLVLGSATEFVATNGGATTYYATAGALLGYMQIRLNGANVKIPVYAP